MADIGDIETWTHTVVAELKAAIHKVQPLTLHNTLNPPSGTGGRVGLCHFAKIENPRSRRLLQRYQCISLRESALEYETVGVAKVFKRRSLVDLEFPDNAGGRAPAYAWCRLPRCKHESYGGCKIDG